MTLAIRSVLIISLGGLPRAAWLLPVEPKSGSLYPLYVSLRNSVLSVTELPSVAMWHSRLGHMSRKGMETLSRSGYLPSLSFSDFPFCEHCQYGKQTRTSRNVHFKKDRQPLDLIHNDVCGPMPT